MKTIADILKERNARISEGSFWLIWDEDRMLGCWQIFKAEGGFGHLKTVLVFESVDEPDAAAEFLRLTRAAQEAYENLERAAESWIIAVLASGQSVPLPDSTHHFNRFNSTCY